MNSTSGISYPGDDSLRDALRHGGPINLPRAREVMERHGLEAIVTGDPLNVFHILGYWPQIANTKLGHPPTTFAILPRDPARPTAVVTSDFIYYYSFADGALQPQVQPFLFADTGNDGTVEVNTQPMWGFADRHEAEVTAVEQRRRSAVDSVSPDQRFRNAGGALAGALRALGLWNGRIAHDHDVIASVAALHNRPGTLVPADTILREIRIIKSPLELRLMRRAAQANADAVDAVMTSVRAGAGYGDLRRQFAIESARRDNQAVFMTVDRVSSELIDSDRISDGQTLFLDGVGHFQHYHGDYARTVFVGEPLATACRAGEAVRAGWTAVREALRPGLRYSEIVAIGTEAVRKAGYDHMVGFGPHSVGLMHSDEPSLDGGGFYRKDDLILQPDMVLSVDCPIVEVGFGGSAHIEDLVRITTDGAEPIHSISDHLVTV
ncbi:MAG TPA: M24 family metallopeptidase [Sphingobium sp.]